MNRGVAASTVTRAILRCELDLFVILFPFSDPM
jgi:hypothetical protein